MLRISEDPQPAFDWVEEGEGDQGGEGTLKAREDTVETENALKGMFRWLFQLRERWEKEDRGVKLFIRGEGRLGMFQILLRDPGIFLGRIPLPSDQEGAGRRSSVVAYDLLNFIFLFSIDKVRRWHRKVPAVDVTIVFFLCFYCTLVC